MPLKSFSYEHCDGRTAKGETVIVSHSIDVMTSNQVKLSRKRLTTYEIKYQIYYSKVAFKCLLLRHIILASGLVRPKYVNGELFALIKAIFFKDVFTFHRKNLSANMSPFTIFIIMRQGRKSILQTHRCNIFSITQVVNQSDREAS